MSTFQYGSCGRGIPIAGILNPADETTSTTQQLPSHGRHCSVNTAHSHNAGSHHPPAPSSDYSMRGYSPASTSSSSRSRSTHHSASPAASSPELAHCKGLMRNSESNNGHMPDRRHTHGPPTPPNDDHDRSHDRLQASLLPSISCLQPHPNSKTGRPCPCEPCKSLRSNAHALAADRYRQAMSEILLHMDMNHVSGSTAERLSAFFGDNAASDEHEAIFTASFSSSSSTTNHLSKKEAHKHKEKSRRDTQKSFLLTLSALTPSTFQPCTAHRHAKNNVEEPAHMTTLDRAALYMATQRLTLDRLVREGRIGRHEVETAMVAEIKRGVTIVRDMVGKSEGFVGECRSFGVLNVGMEMEGGDIGASPGGEIGERRREGGGTKNKKVTKRKDVCKRRRGA